MSYTVNSLNQRKATARNRSTGVLGVTQHYHKYAARIGYRGRTIYLGLFDTVEEASDVVAKERERLIRSNGSAKRP